MFHTIQSPGEIQVLTASKKGISKLNFQQEMLRILTIVVRKIMHTIALGNKNSQILMFWKVSGKSPPSQFPPSEFPPGSELGFELGLG